MCDVIRGGEQSRTVVRRRSRRSRAASLCALLLMAMPAGRAEDGDALVIVNGAPISKNRITELLIEAYGVEVMQQVIVLELARQESRRRGLEVTPADVDREERQALHRIVAESGMTAEDATEENKRNALLVVLEQRRISLAEFKLGMERNAHLRKIVTADFHVDEETLREEFARTFGEKVRVRHIQIPIDNPSALNHTVTLLRRGADFASVAQAQSVNRETAARGGELPPFSFDDREIDPLIREAAFALSPGEISNPVRAGQFFHVLKLEERIEPANVRFEDVRDEVEARMRERVIPEKMAELAAELFQKANIRVLDPRLRERYQTFLEESTERR